MPGRNIIVIGASAGGIEPLRGIIAALPADLPAAVFVVVHVGADSRSVLPALLERAGRLEALHCPDRCRFRNGIICIAPPDHHLVLHDGEVRLTRGPRENNCRPAVDVLFRTAALWHGARVIGVVLSGNLDDGTAGLRAIKERGGVTVVQDPAEALFTGMPASAARHVACDHVLPADQIGPLLVELALTPVSDAQVPPPPPELVKEIQFAEAAMIPDPSAPDDHPGEPSSYACPDCGGALWQLREGDLVRFRCRVGHAYSPDTLLSEQGRAFEDALWVALRALEESESVCTRLAERSGKRSSPVAATFRARAAEARRNAAAIRDLLAGGEPGARDRNTGSPGRIVAPPARGNGNGARGPAGAANTRNSAPRDGRGGKNQA